MLANLSALVFVPLLLVEVNGLSLAAAGLVLTPGAVAQAILSPVAGRLSDRVGVRLPVLVGLGIMALSVLFISTFAGASPELIAAGILGVGTGFAFIQSLPTTPPQTPSRKRKSGAEWASSRGPSSSVAGRDLRSSGRSWRPEKSLIGGDKPPYTLDAAPFSDAFLAIVPALILALIAASGLRGRTKSK